MDEKRLAEIKARAEAATPGPWKVWNAYGHKKQVFCERIGPDYPGGIRAIKGFDFTGTEPDLAFIAHARQDIPDLLEAVERLRDFAAG